MKKIFTYPFIVSTLYITCLKNNKYRLMNAATRKLEIPYLVPKVRAMKVQGIPIFVYKDIRENLQRFELEKMYLAKGVTLSKLALKFGTNRSYLSRVINLAKGRNFSNYINELRLDYIYDELVENQKYQRYTVKAISEEIGFGSAECFSRSFYLKFGLYPSAYIEQLRN